MPSDPEPDSTPASPAAIARAEAVLGRCDLLADYTEEPGRITRRFLCEPMRGVHQRIGDWMTEAGLSHRVDPVGNLVGRLAAADECPTLLVGSHLDTVPGGGRYDGVLGVMIGLAVAEALRGVRLPFHLDVIGFSEEEGIRYNKPYLGSSGAAGVFRAEWLDRTDADGVALRDAIRSFGLDADRTTAAGYAASEVLGYVEPHLEQGPMLETRGAPVGVVSAISGQSRLRIEFVGEAGHAGTTPMAGRRDALASASGFVCRVRELAESIDGLRATVGRLAVTPNAPNVIPERVEMSLDVRHEDDGVRERAISSLLDEADRIARDADVTARVIERTSQRAVAVESGLADLMASAVEEVGAPALRLPSGAGHDAVAMAESFPIAMLFVRHPGGVSHHPDERVDRDDVAVAIDVLTRFVLRLADRVRREPTQAKATPARAHHGAGRHESTVR